MKGGYEKMGRPSSSKPTSFDIAYLAGVSQPTVSRALRGSRSVSPKTREKIERIAHELNYIVDKNASSLRSQRSNTIALLFFEDPTSDESMINPFFLSMLGSITRECASYGYDLLISFQQMSNDWHNEYQDCHRADGLILLGYGDYQIYESRLKHLMDQGTFFVRWGSIRDDNIGLTVGSDNVAAGILVGNHLIEKGRQNIVFLGTASDQYPEFQDRYRGLCKAISDSHRTIEIPPRFDAITTEESGYQAAIDLISSDKSFDAIFAGSDLIAIGAMRALNENGYSLPDDVAIVGFDDIPAAHVSTPPLTTIVQEMKGAGAALVATLISHIENRPIHPQKLPTKLIIRQSCG